jgi:glycosyltransferase involved in cell wall biosynthesis/tetratricopeptide (TPR) repeat protein
MSAIPPESRESSPDKPQRRVQSAVRWMGPIFNPSGYASEAINFIIPLSRRLDLSIFHNNLIFSETFLVGLAPGERATLLGLHKKFEGVRGGIAILHNPASGFQRVNDAAWCIGRTMFETDRIPQDWADRCNRLDEVWVPSPFNVESFAAGGVKRDKLVVVPGAVDETLFNPDLHHPLPLAEKAGFNFLSVFEWSARKAWDVLLAAYLREFSAEDDVCLHLRAYLTNKPDTDARQEMWGLIRRHAETLQLGNKPWPRINIIDSQVAASELPRLYKAADCLVAPSRGEGWGRPHHEAMMMCVPVIATNWSGNTMFMDGRNSYLLDFEIGDTQCTSPELAHYRGHRWAHPSEAHLRQLMRHVQTHPGEARARGQIARADVLARFSREPVADIVEARLIEIERRLSSPVAPAVVARDSCGPSLGKAKVAWEGTFLDLGSLSHVNRALTKELRQDARIELVCVGNNNAGSGSMLALDLRREMPKDARILVRHQWPPNWSAPANGCALVTIQPWEFGSLPTCWIPELAKVDEIWAYSEYVRRVYIDSGIPAKKVKVVPLGVDPEEFNPRIVPMDLKTRKKFKFLFVGGTIQRKGPDVLLRAYLDSFTSADDVCLVIKDFGGKSVYAGQTIESQIRSAQAQAGAPEILYLNEEFGGIGGLYTACNCLVHPYRGEGFGLPVLEAMACGLPVIVTADGATDDFATDDFAYRIPSVRKPFGDKVGDWPLVHTGWMLEPDLAAVSARMLWVYRNQAEASEKGRKAGDHVRQAWTWSRAAGFAADRLSELAGRKDAEDAAIAVRRSRKTEKVELPPAARLGQLREARALFEKRDHKGAWSAVLNAIGLRPYHPEAYLLLAQIALEARDSVTARKCAQRACEMAPGWRPARKFLESNPKGNARLDWLVPPEDFGKGKGGSRLSVCMIVKNEESFLAQCLLSVKDIAFQIVVVDTGSTDRTIEIARAFGAEVHRFPWCDDFSAARNAALEHVRGDWVLSLDADEEITPENRTILLREMGDPKTLAYRLPIIDKGLEEQGASYVPRLFRNAPGLFFLGRVHEQVFSSIEARRIEWGLNNALGKAALLHYGYSSEVTQSRDKIQRNLRLLEKAVDEMPNEPSLLMNYGLELTRAGREQDGLEQYWEAYHVMAAQPAGELVPELRETLLTQLCSRLMGANRFEDVIGVLSSPLAASGAMTASLHFSLGLAFLRTKRFADAERQMRHCLAKRDLPALAPINPEIKKAGPNHCLALCLVELKRHPEAEAALNAALADAPQASGVRFDMARLHADRGRMVEALQVLNALVADCPDNPMYWQFGGQIALSKPDYLEFAMDWTSEAVRNLPDNAALLAQRAEALTLNQRPAEAMPLWSRLAAARSPAPIAALILCELAGSRDANSFPLPLQPGVETALSQEFLKWYQKLISFNAGKLIAEVNQNLGRLDRVLPSAAHRVRLALREVGENGT